MGQDCACKGIRFCAYCKDDERVRKLRSDPETFDGFKVFVFSSAREVAVRVPSLTVAASLEDIIYHSENAQTSTEEVLAIDGLLLIHNFLNEDEECYLVNRIDHLDWVQSQSGRRKQDYGPQVNFKHKKLKMDKFVGMPDYADMLLDKMQRLRPDSLSNYQPYEMCNLEYNQDRLSAIEMHQDDMWIWGNRLISINLLSGSVMTLSNEKTRQLCFVWMPRLSLLCMADTARYDWRHGVFAQHIRGRRIAVTMREPSQPFQEDGELYEKYGKELARIGKLRIPLGN